MRVPMLALGLLVGLTAAAQEAPRLEPPKVRLFAVGVIAFGDSESFSSYPQKGRRDVELVQWFKEQGTPGADAVYLQDAQATLSKVRAAFRRHLDASEPGETLVFYYTGHGSRLESGATYLIPYDGKGKDVGGTGWPVTEVLEDIRTRFKGEQVWLLADCCYSGALGREAKAGAGKLRWASLCSSLASTPSTGNWTFTESLLAGLRGDPRVDLDGDGEVLLTELASYAESEMAFVDGQLSSFARGGGFADRLRLAARVGAAVTKPERIEVEWKGDWYPARVQKRDGEKVFVRYAGFGAEWDEWVGPERQRPYAPEVLPAGTKVMVEWKKQWWPAVVLEGKLGLHKIHYDGYSDVWDEWVSPKRLKKR